MPIFCFLTDQWQDLHPLATLSLATLSAMILIKSIDNVK